MLELNGHWGIIWDEFVDPTQVSIAEKTIAVPSDWDQINPWIPRIGIANYILKVSGFNPHDYPEGFAL